MWLAAEGPELEFRTWSLGLKIKVLSALPGLLLHPVR